jgi:hypothetical protein
VTRSISIPALTVGAALACAGSATAQQFNAVTPSATPYGNPPAVSVAGIDPQLRNTADLTGIVRANGVQVGVVNIMEYNAHGTITDWETPGAKPVDVDNFTFNVSLFDNASRITFQGQTVPLTTRVVRGTEAWDESWAKDGNLNATPADAKLVTVRRIMMWLEPHAFLHAAVFQANKKCPDNSACASLPAPAVGKDATGKVTITANIEGNAYVATLGPDQRPAKIVTTVGGHTYEADYFGYRNGTSLGQEALDKMHNGTYWPSRVTFSVDNQKDLDVIVTAGWTNPYSIYPDPQQLAKEQ